MPGQGQVKGKTTACSRFGLSDRLGGHLGKRTQSPGICLRRVPCGYEGHTYLKRSGSGTNHKRSPKGENLKYAVRHMFSGSLST